MKTTFRLLCLVLLVVLALASPALADPVKPSKTSESAQLSRSLDNLLAAQKKQPNSAELQQQIDELQWQKTALESGLTWGQCRNQTGKTLAIYGPGSEDSESDHGLYFLADGATTPEGWDCDGFYLPAGTKVTGLDVGQPLVYTVATGSQLVARANPDGALVLSEPAAAVVKADDSDWTIPNLSQAFIASRIPSALTTGDLND